MSDFEKTYSITIITKKARDTLRRLRKSVDKLDKKIIAAAANSQRLVNRLGAMGKALVVVEHNAKDAGRSVNTFVAKTVVGAKKAEKSVKKIGTSLKKVGVNLKAFGRNMSMYVTLPLTVAAGLSLKLARNLNKGMAEVGTLLSGGKEQIEGLKQGVRDLAKDTGKPLEDLTGGLYEVVSAFGEGEENLSQLAIATRAGVAGVASTKDAVSLLSAVTKGYGDTSAKAQQKAADLAFQTVELGQTTFPQLAASMGRVIPFAAAMNTSQEELFGTMATLTGVTGGAAEVSTQLASIYSAFLKPSEELTKLADKQGFATATAMLKTKGLAETMRILGKATGGEADKVAKFISRKEGQIAALALLNGQSDEYTRKLGEMKKAAGATDEAYRIQTEGINKQGHEWEITKRRMEDAAITIGDKLLPILGRLMDVMEPMINYVSELDDESLDWAIAIAGVAAAIGPLIKSLGLLKIAMAFLIANPIVAILAGTALTLGLIYTNSELVHGSFEYLITSFELLWKYYKKFTTGAAVSFFSKILGFDASDSEYSMEGYDRDIADAKDRRSSIDFRDKDVVNREAKNKLSLNKTASNISKYGGGGGAGFSDDFSMQSLAGAGAGGGGGTSIGGTVVNFNGPVADPAKAVRQAGRAARAEDRKRAKQYDSTANNSGPMEQ